MTFKKNGSTQRFKELTYPHMKLLYNVALKYTGNVFDAEDIVQETYLMAFNKFHQLKEPSSCKPWLLRILRNNFLKTCQKSRSRLRIEEGDYIEFLKARIREKGPDDQLAEAATARMLNAAVGKLPIKYREVLLLYYMNEMRYKEIAKALDIPMGTVMSRLTRAREALKTKVLKAARASGDTILDINIKQKVPR